MWMAVSHEGRIAAHHDQQLGGAQRERVGSSRGVRVRGLEKGAFLRELKEAKEIRFASILYTRSSEDLRLVERNWEKCLLRF